jgi:uncharacterized membrane protein
MRRSTRAQTASAVRARMELETMSGSPELGLAIWLRCVGPCTNARWGSAKLPGRFFRVVRTFISTSPFRPRGSESAVGDSGCVCAWLFWSALIRSLSSFCLHFFSTFSALVDATPDLARKFGPPFRPLLFGTPASRLRFPHFGDQGRSIPKAFHVDLKPLSPYAVRFVLNPGGATCRS